VTGRAETSFAKDLDEDEKGTDVVLQLSAFTICESV
jgi:hypothetical protein